MHTDRLGRPEAITNASKSVVWRAEPTTFGTRNVTQSSIGTFNIGFPGQYWDQEKESWYNLNRDYNPETGRYLQSDPIGLAGGMNTYVYVGANPIKFVDYYGLFAWPSWSDFSYNIGIGGALFGGIKGVSGNLIAGFSVNGVTVTTLKNAEVAKFTMPLQFRFISLLRLW